MQRNGVAQPGMIEQETQLAQGEKTIEAYVYSSCTSCRKSLEQIRESGAEFRSRDYFRERFSKDELTDLLNRLDLVPSLVLSTRSRAYRERELDAEAMSDDELLSLMIEEPTLLRRPIITKGDHVVIGHNPGQLAELIAS